MRRLLMFPCLRFRICGTVSVAHAGRIDAQALPSGGVLFGLIEPVDTVPGAQLRLNEIQPAVEQQFCKTEIDFFQLSVWGCPDLEALTDFNWGQSLR